MEGRLAKVDPKVTNLDLPSKQSKTRRIVHSKKGGSVLACVHKQPESCLETQNPMKPTTISSKTKVTNLAAAIALLGLGAIQAHGQSVNFTFSDGTSDGWANAGFSGSPVASVVNISGQNYISLSFSGFQAGNVASDSAGVLAGFNAAMSAALNNPAGYTLSYNWYVNTANWSSNSTYLQLGSFVNTGKGYYEQDFGSPNEVQLNGTQMASGQVYQGTVTVPFTVFSPADTNAAVETYFRLGLIENSNGSGSVQFTDITVAPVPEPSSLILFGLGLTAGTAFLRRRKGGINDANGSEQREI